MPKTNKTSFWEKVGIVKFWNIVTFQKKSKPVPQPTSYEDYLKSSEKRIEQLRHFSEILEGNYGEIVKSILSSTLKIAEHLKGDPAQLEIFHIKNTDNLLMTLEVLSAEGIEERRKAKIAELKILADQRLKFKEFWENVLSPCFHKFLPGFNYLQGTYEVKIVKYKIVVVRRMGRVADATDSDVKTIEDLRFDYDGFKNWKSYNLVRKFCDELLSKIDSGENDYTKAAEQAKEINCYLDFIRPFRIEFKKQMKGLIKYSFDDSNQLSIEKIPMPVLKALDFEQLKGASKDAYNHVNVALDAFVNAHNEYIKNRDYVKLNSMPRLIDTTKLYILAWNDYFEGLCSLDASMSKLKKLLTSPNSRLKDEVRAIINLRDENKLRRSPYKKYLQHVR